MRGSLAIQSPRLHAPDTRLPPRPLRPSLASCSESAPIQAHRPSARAKALDRRPDSALRARSRGARLLPRLPRETSRAANGGATVTLAAGSRLGPYEIVAASRRGRHGGGLPREGPAPRHATSRSRFFRPPSPPTPTACAASSRRRKPPGSSTIPTSRPSTTSASKTARRTSSRSSSRARRSARFSPAAGSHRARRSTIRSRSFTALPRRTRRGSSTGTSSPRTSSSPTTAG